MSLDPSASDDLARATRILLDGGLVAFPTETVYGLGADATNDAALARLYAVKGRPADHPVIVHVAQIEQFEAMALDPPEYARTLADYYWPGPLTLIVRRVPGTVSDLATGGLDTVGIRIPDHPLALELLESVGHGVAAPSANRFGKVSPTTAAHVASDLGADVDFVLDGGASAIGVESTIVDCTGDVPRVLREGGVSMMALLATLGTEIRRGGATKAPGTLASHYAPVARVDLVEARELRASVAAATAAGDTVAVLAPLAALAGLEWDDDVVVLDAPADADEYARVLYARLRQADARDVDVVVAVAPVLDGIGAAVADRLRRASHH